MPGDGTRTTIAVFTGADFAEAVRDALPALSGNGEVLVLPSSLLRTDRLAQAVRQELRRGGIDTHLVLPANPVAALIRRSPRGSGERWAEVEIRTPDRPSVTVRLPARLTRDMSIWSVTDVDRVGGTGPYVLDLVARYLHPASRFRQIATPRRADAAVDLNLAVMPSRFVVGKTLGGRAVVGLTTDAIAAELFALALADEDLPPNRSVAGPWEDRVVQRATELELGIQIPRQLAIDIAGQPREGIREAIGRVAGRIGVPLA